MAASSIQVSEETREALKRYKVEGMTYDQVLRLMMDVLPAEDFHQLYREWQRKVAAQIGKSRKWKPLL